MSLNRQNSLIPDPIKWKYKLFFFFKASFSSQHPADEATYVLSPVGSNLGVPENQQTISKQTTPLRGLSEPLSSC